MNEPAAAPFPYPENQRKLSALARSLRRADILDLFARDPDRADKYRARAAGWQLDFSRHLLDDEALNELRALARTAGLGEAGEALFDGRKLNYTENRSVLHTLLRSPRPHPGLREAWRDVRNCLARLETWVDRVHSGEHRGHGGERIRHVVNLGIGGSDLGPRLAVQALRPYRTGRVEVRFCANIDPAELGETLEGLDPGRTLFIVCSKSLRTEETLHNAELARRWIIDGGAGEAAMDRHFLAVSNNLEAARRFGIPPENILPVWDWVGGRYSLWSAAGWSIAFAIGREQFAALRAGAAAMDDHFRDTPLRDNLPVLLSLLEIWYVNFFDAPLHAVIPYDHRLRRLPAFLQQLSMESNGKRRNRQGRITDYATAPVLWGDEGTNGQHSFHQFLHQGTPTCPVDFVVPMRGHPEDDEDGRGRLVANCLSQGQALLIGRSLEESRASLLRRGVGAAEAEALAPHLAIPGNRPSSTLSCERLTPAALGALLALYEHKTFCSGHIWQINSFDQWGVELGKELSGPIYESMGGSSAANPEAPADTGESSRRAYDKPGHSRYDELRRRDPSTDELIRRWRSSVDQG